MIGEDEYNLVYVALPGTIYACVRIDADGYPTIYMNVFLSPEARRRALAHELHHFENGDFFNHISIYDAEADAIRSERSMAVMTRAFRDLTPEESSALMEIGHTIFAALDEIDRWPLPNRLSKLRRLKGFTLDELAEITHVKADDLRAYEQGRAQPDDALLARLSRLYGTDLIGKEAATCQDRH